MMGGKEKKYTRKCRTKERKELMIKEKRKMKEEKNEREKKEYINRN